MPTASIPRLPVHRTAIALAFLFGLCAPLGAQQSDWTDLSARRQTDGIRSIDARITYVAGELEVGAAEQGLLYDIGLRYDAARLRPERSWKVDGNAGRLDLRFESAGDSETEWDFDDDEFGMLRLGLSREVPASLRLEVGAAEATLELGGIPLAGLIYRTGASRTEINFESPNPDRMERMELAAGAAEFEAWGLGNAGFEALEFEGAVGDVTLDFTGEWTRDAVAEISVGLGSLRLILPRDLGVRLEKTGFLAGFDPGGMEKVESGWQTQNWDSAGHRLRIDLKAAFGKVDIRFDD
jgi:hypothetical protein